MENSMEHTVHYTATLTGLPVEVTFPVKRQAFEAAIALRHERKANGRDARDIKVTKGE